VEASDDEGKSSSEEEESDGDSAVDVLDGWEGLFDDDELTPEDVESDPFAEAARASKARSAEMKLQWIQHAHALSSALGTITEGFVSCVCVRTHMCLSMCAGLHVLACERGRVRTNTDLVLSILRFCRTSAGPSS
jgi:hypothetical protein